MLIPWLAGSLQGLIASTGFFILPSESLAALTRHTALACNPGFRLSPPAARRSMSVSQRVPGGVPRLGARPFGANPVPKTPGTTGDGTGPGAGTTTDSPAATASPHMRKPASDSPCAREAGQEPRTLPPGTPG